MTRYDQLTSTEIAILNYLADGLTYAEISEKLQLSEHTIIMFSSTACGKLGARTRLNAIALFVRYSNEHIDRCLR